MASITWLILIAHLLLSIATVLSETPEVHCRRTDVKNRDPQIKYLLRLQWLPGQCKAIPSCVESRVEDSMWTIHGLWAAKFCKGDHEFRNNVLTEELTDELNKYWIDIKNQSSNNELFWECEYKKHGCATNWKQLKYFTKAIRLYEQHNPGPKLTKAGLKPGENYSSAKFESAFDSLVLLKCNEDNSISELEVCLDHNYKAIDCDDDKTEACSKGNDIIYLTKNQQESTHKYIKIKRRNIW